MNLFSFIKEHVVLLDVINEYTKLKKMGIYWKGVCPFHQEKDASFTVSTQKGVYYCFGCHAGGDVISFIAQAENCTPLEAAHHLADRYHIEIPAQLSTPSEQNVVLKQEHAHLCQAVAIWCHTQLLKTPAAVSYVQQRGLSDKTIKKQHIGLFPSGAMALQTFVQAMKKNNILMKDLSETGFVLEGKNGLYSPFEDRIIFPIKDHLGRFCGFGGRIFNPEDTRAKYYNSRDNASFNKGSLLFGLDYAKKDIQHAGTVFLVEGYMDYVVMDQFGYHNTVATLGTACTQEHLTQLSRYAHIVYVLYDGDAAGQQAMLRLAQLCWHCSLELQVIQLPKGEDPASWLTKQGDLAPFIAQTKDIFSFFIAHIGTQFAAKSLQEKLKLTQKIIDLVKQIDNSLKRDLILQEAAQKFDIPFDCLTREFHRSGGKSSPEKRQTPQSTEATHSTASNSALEKKLFFAIINNIQNEFHDEAFFIDYFSEPLRTILIKLKHEKENQNAIDFNYFFSTLASDEQKIVSRIMVECEDFTGPGMLEALREQFQKKHWKSMVHDIVMQLEQAKKDGNTHGTQKLLEQFLELKKKYYKTAPN